jgi:hypothetical protein
MLIRQILAALMVLMSLSAQARTVLVCGMSPVVMAVHPCCPQEHKQAAGTAGEARPGCCDVLAPGDAPLAQLVSARDWAASLAAVDVGQPAPRIDMALAAAVAPIDDPPGRYHVAADLDAGRHRLLALYLQTARLRL